MQGMYGAPMGGMGGMPMGGMPMGGMPMGGMPMGGMPMGGMPMGGMPMGGMPMPAQPAAAPDPEQLQRQYQAQQEQLQQQYQTQQEQLQQQYQTRQQQLETERTQREAALQAQQEAERVRAEQMQQYQQQREQYERAQREAARAAFEAANQPLLNNSEIGLNPTMIAIKNKTDRVIEAFVIPASAQQFRDLTQLNRQTSDPVNGEVLAIRPGQETIPQGGSRVPVLPNTQTEFPYPENAYVSVVAQSRAGQGEYQLETIEVKPGQCYQVLPHRFNDTTYKWYADVYQQRQLQEQQRQQLEQQRQEQMQQMQQQQQQQQPQGAPQNDGQPPYVLQPGMPMPNFSQMRSGMGAPGMGAPGMGAPGMMGAPMGMMGPRPMPVIPGYSMVGTGQTVVMPNQ